MKNVVRKIIVTVLVGIVSVMALAGCGGNVNESADTLQTEESITVSEVASEEESGVVGPFAANLEKYDKIISQLNKDQWYAFADINKDYDVLLVTDYTYDNLDGNMAAIDATLYGLDENGDVYELGTVQSAGTAYPLSVYNQCLLYGGNHCVHMIFVEGGSMITKLYADEIFDEEGNATYSVFDYDEHFEGNVDDDTKLMEMYDIYGQATVINFTKVE